MLWLAHTIHEEPHTKGSPFTVHAKEEYMVVVAYATRTRPQRAANQLRGLQPSEIHVNGAGPCKQGIHVGQPVILVAHPLPMLLHGLAQCRRLFPPQSLAAGQRDSRTAASEGQHSGRSSPSTRGRQDRMQTRCRRGTMVPLPHGTGGLQGAQLGE